MTAYLPLLGDPDVVDAAEDREWIASAETKSSRFGRCTRHPTTGTDAFFLTPLLVVACALSVLSFSSTFWGRQTVEVVAPATLRFPNPYIGLDTAVLKTFVPEPVMNFPRLLAQINASDPTVAYPQYPRWRTFYGTVYTEHRHFLITSEVSTVAQYRMMDFGMERCAAKLQLPPAEELAHLPEKEFSTSGGLFPLEIWMLDTPNSTIDARTLSWTTRPSRSRLLLRETLAALDVETTIETAEFDCPARSVFSLEIRCGGVDCMLQFNQSIKAPTMAFFVEQRPSR